MPWKLFVPSDAIDARTVVDVLIVTSAPVSVMVELARVVAAVALGTVLDVSVELENSPAPPDTPTNGFDRKSDTPSSVSHLGQEQSDATQRT